MSGRDPRVGTSAQALTSASVPRAADRRRSVCLFTDSMEPSGVGEHMLGLARELRAELDLSFVCPPTAAGGRLLERAAALGLRVLPLEARGNGAAQARLGAWLRLAGVDIFHAHAGIGWEGHHGVRAARAAGVPVVIRTEHLPNVMTDPAQQRTYTAMSRLVDRTICVSGGVARSYAAVGVPRSGLRVVHNGVASPEPRAGARRGRALGLPRGSRLLLSVGRLTAQKGHADLIRALPLVLQAAPDVHLAIAGSGALEAELRTLTRSLGLDGRVRLLGQRDDVPDLMLAAALVVLPSRFEGLPLAALEAMALGRAVIGTRVCGMSEAVKDRVTGRLVPVGRPGALGAAIVDALEDDAMRASWESAARARFTERFTAARMAAQIARVYREFAELRARSAEPLTTRRTA
ncbi:MAG: glycosyltransferase family 4 protein [Candidatus Limnocylindria bacterium]